MSSKFPSWVTENSINLLLLLLLLLQQFIPVLDETFNAQLSVVYGVFGCLNNILFIAHLFLSFAVVDYLFQKAGLFLCLLQRFNFLFFLLSDSFPTYFLCSLFSLKLLIFYTDIFILLATVFLAVFLLLVQLFF